MTIYVIFEALAGIIGGVLLAKRTKKAEDVTYGRLDKIGRVTNALLSLIYIIASPFYLFLGMICEPDGKGVLWIFGLIVSLIAASAGLFCCLGIGGSVALRKKGKSGLSFAVQFAGIVGIALTLLLYVVFEGSLISSLN